jgi:hypothetical protein
MRQNQERLRRANSRDPITYEHLQIKLYPCGEEQVMQAELFRLLLMEEMCFDDW